MTVETFQAAKAFVGGSSASRNLELQFARQIEHFACNFTNTKKRTFTQHNPPRQVALVLFQPENFLQVCSVSKIPAELPTRQIYVFWLAPQVEKRTIVKCLSSLAELPNLWAQARSTAEAEI